MRTSLSLIAGTLLIVLPVIADSVTPVDTAYCVQLKAHNVIHDGAPVPCERLSVVTFAYVDFAGVEHTDGRVVVMDALAPRVLKIFQALHARHFPLAKAVPIEAYDGNDDASMADNNTSAFNHRAIKATGAISLHAYGAAIDINTVQNPYLVFAQSPDGPVIHVEPPNAAAFVNRNGNRPDKPKRAGLAEEVVQIFAENGFSDWGGNWDDPIDYQHFDVGRPLAEKLAGLPPDTARQVFEKSISGASNVQ